MNVQKDLIQHIAVLTVAPGYLNFAQPRSSEIIHVGLAETKQLLTECLRIMAVEDGGRDVFRAAGACSVFEPYAKAFRCAADQIEAVDGQIWDDDLDARYALEPIVNPLDSFLSAEHWYDMGYARLIQSADGAFYSDRSPVRVNFNPNWRLASLFFSADVADCVREMLWQRERRNTEPVPLLSLAPPQGYLWMARTYAPQSPQNLINYWEAMLPGARRVRIRQMVNQQQGM